MVKLAVIADDLTGALDTGIKFSKRGISTRVFTSLPLPFNEISGDTEAMIIDTETRHKSSKAAGGLVFELVSACQEQGIHCFYKKTDSALRGHVGAELAALYKAAGKPVHFIPALPEEDRYTWEGIHYIRGVPVSESIFGKDPFNPVTCSSVCQLIQMETDVPAASVSAATPAKDPDCTAGIVIHDGRSEEDLTRIGMQLKEKQALDITAGCAGFARFLADHLDFHYRDPTSWQKKKKMIVLSGSINEVTGRQLTRAEEKGFFRHSLSSREKLDRHFMDTPEGTVFLNSIKEECLRHDKMIIDVYSPDAIEEVKDYARRKGIPGSEIAPRIAARMGEIFTRIIDVQPESLIMIIGGDTLFSAISQCPGLILNPIGEPAAGTVLIKGTAGDHTLSLLSKSGGFGGEDILIDLANQLLF